MRGLDNLALAREAHACTHTTFSPNVVHGGIKMNVIPDRVEIDVDIRALPGVESARGGRDARGGAGRPGLAA